MGTAEGSGESAAIKKRRAESGGQRARILFPRIRSLAVDPRWLTWVKKLRALTQNGLAYEKDPFDIERYEEMREIVAEMAAAYTDGEPEEILGLFRAETGYATPKLDARGVVFKDDGILLVKELPDGLWALPGGWIDVGESPSEAVEREVREESGYEVRATKLLAVYDRNKHPHPSSSLHIYKLFFLCELVGGAPAKSIETDGAEFFPLDSIPELSIVKVTHEQIRRLFEHKDHPEWAADFD